MHDLKESGVNRAYTAVDKLALHDIDYVASLAHLISTTVTGALASGGKVSIPLSNLQTLEGVLHPDFAAKETWQGRCIDLSKAYKQVAVSEESRCFAMLLVHHPETQQPTYFISRSLPFGASASVFAFNRISRSIHHLAAEGCKILGGVFYDDFPLIEPSSTCRLASFSFEGLLKNLGWMYTADPSKVKPFAPTFDVLGIRLSVGDLGLGVFTLENKLSRVEKIASLLKEVSDAAKISIRQAQVIHGNLNFAMGFYMGHSVKIAARAFAYLSSDRRSCKPGALRDLCMWTTDLFTALRAKEVRAGEDKAPVIVFADAAYEDGVATWGIVLVDPVSGLRTAAGGKIPSSLVDTWHGFGVDQVIS